MKRIITYLTYALISVFAVSGQSNEDAYTLDQLIAEALENNYDIRISETDLDIAELNNSLGNAGMLPTLMWESSLNNSFNDRYDGDNQSGSLQNGVRLNWVLFNGFSAHIRKDHLETMEQLSGGNLSLVVENTIQAVVMAYYRALFAEQQLSLLKEVMQVSQDRLTYSEDSRELGTATSYEVLQARTAFLTDKTAYLEQEVAVLSSIRQLKYLTGMEESQALKLDGDLTFEAGEYALDELLTQIAANNRSIRNQYLNLALLEKQRILQQRSRFPSLNATAGAGHNVHPESLNSAGGTNGYSDGYFSYYANFSLSFTLFDGDRINRNIQIARMEEVIGQTNLEEMKHRLKNQLFNLYDTYNVRKELVSVGKENMETARVNMQLSEEKFRAGAINSFNYRDVQVNYLQTSINYYRSVLNLVDTHTDLVRITGGIVEEYE